MKTVILLLAIFFSFNSYSQTQWEQSNIGSCNYFIKSFWETPNSLLASGTCLSTDSGSTWNLLSGGKFAFCMIETGAGIFAGSDSAIFLSSDGGVTWTASYQTGSPLNFVYDLAVSNDTLFAATRASGVLMTPDNGATWSSMNAGLPSDSTYTLLVKDNILFVGLLNHGIYTSIDAGISWVSANTGIPSNTTINDIVADGQNIYASAGNTIYISVNQGAGWTPSPGAPNSINKLAVIGNSLLAGCFTPNGSGGLYRSLDQGQSWQTFNAGLPTGCAYGVSSIYSGSYYVYLGMESQCGRIYRMEKSQFTTSINTPVSAAVLYSVNPNPFTDEIKISGNDLSRSKIKLFDMTCRLILEETFYNDLILNTDKLGSGMYYYSILSESNAVKNGTLVKY